MRKSQEVAKYLQRPRMRAGRLLIKGVSGVSQAEVARRVGVTRTTARHLEPGFAAGRSEGAEGQGAWPPLQARLVAARRAPQSFVARCAGRGLSDRSVDVAAGRRADPAPLKASVQRKSSLANPHRIGFLFTAAQLPGIGAQRACDQALAGAKEKTLPDKSGSSSSSTSLG
jgi:hypothetical protein